ncbi:MAG: 50S ribosomal protein L18 [Gammaproteobacteria bacterium]|nr:50S ribosomal protein L18 [Gammaproteobacteria bacterium]MDH5593099.1 50S ribosomal protein L18 [Gammaproteobacteria bacterium]MDH5613714.1 50S ribosomal protein L18 [Gammaproteobacteria bacterium]
MNSKKSTRIRRGRKSRARIKEQTTHRLCVHRTPRHIYAQVIDPSGSQVLASSSTLDAEIRKAVKNSGNKDAASVVGKFIAERAKAKGVTRIAFDRSGFRFHGRIKALADAARENGLEF